MTTELLIRGGTVCDGTGAGLVPGDVLIDGGRIQAVLPRSPAINANEVIDADGCVVAPGFIDVHTHSDVSVLLDGRAESKVHQGVTTEVTGNCGFSAFPLEPARMVDHLDLLAGIGDSAVEPTWSDLAGYAAALEHRGVSVNIAPLVGHGQLRIAANGMTDRLSDDGRERMQALLIGLLEQGAFGLSTGLTYVPSRFAGRAELESLCATLARYGAVYATHARGDVPGSIGEAVHVARATGVRVQFSHIAINHPERWGWASRVLEVMDTARRGGADIAWDVYPYDASASALTQYLPVWIQEGGVASMRARLSDRATLRRAEDDLARGWGTDQHVPWLWDRVVLARTDGVLDAPEGVTVEQAAARAGETPARYVLQLCRAGGNRIQVVLFYRSEDDMRTFLRSAHSLIGSDGSAIPYEQDGRRPHPRAFGAHTRVLGRYTRELADLDLPTAVHKMTGAVATRVGITDRGVLAPGKAADVVVFDPATVNDRATFLDPCRPPGGVSHVIVNGQVVIDGGQQTKARPGRVLRST